MVLVPEQFVAQILALEQEASVVRGNGAWVIPMTTDTLRMPRVVETTRASTLFGGMAAKWTSAAATMTESEPTFGEIMLTVKELTGYSVCSNSLLADNAVALESFLMRAFPQTAAFYEDYAFLQGTGSGQPLGIINAACTIPVARQATSKLYMGDFVRLFTQLLPNARGGAVYVLNHECFPLLIEAHSGNAALASGSNLVWINQNQGLAQGPPGTILGRPFILSEKMSALYSLGDVGFFNFGYYLIGDRSPLTIDASTHVGFTSNQTYWRFVKRVDGQPWLASALTPKNGSATLSPFTILAATS